MRFEMPDAKLVELVTPQGVEVSVDLLVLYDAIERGREMHGETRTRNLDELITVVANLTGMENVQRSQMLELSIAVADEVEKYTEEIKKKMPSTASSADTTDTSQPDGNSGTP